MPITNKDEALVFAAEEIQRLEAEIREARLLVGDLLGIPPDAAAHLNLVEHLQQLVACEGRTRYQQGRFDAFAEVIAHLEAERRRLVTEHNGTVAMMEKYPNNDVFRYRAHAIACQISSTETLIGLAQEWQKRLPTPERGLTPGLKRLLVGFLEDHVERLSRAGCNDWDWPEGLEEADRAVVMAAIRQGSPEFEGEPFDFIVVQALIAILDA